MSLATIDPARPSVTIEMAGRFGMDPRAFEQTLRATIFPSNGTREQFAAFLLVARQYDLNPITKEIYAFPGKGGIVPIVGIDGWLKLVNSHPAFDGMQFEENNSDGELVSITCSIWRKDRSKPIVVTEHLSECFRVTEPWKMKHRMLRHKAMIQCARYAFGFAGIYDPDEGERIVLAQDGRHMREALDGKRHLPTPPTPPAPVPAPVLTVSADSATRKQLEASVAQIEAPKGFDFDAFRVALDAVDSIEEANAVWDQFIETATIITSEETEEAQRILAEACEPFWKATP